MTMPFASKLNANTVTSCRRRCARTDVADLFIALVREADSFAPPVGVDLTTKLNDDAGEDSPGSYYSPSRHVIHILVELEGVPRPWTDLVCVLAHELGHANDVPPPKPLTWAIRTGREIVAWDWAEQKLRGHPLWIELRGPFDELKQARIERYCEKAREEARSAGI